MENELNENTRNGNSMEDASALKERLAYMERREKELMKEKEDMEAEFGLKRAKLKDLFLQKEDELVKEREASSSIQNDKDDLNGEIARLQRELDECKSQVTVAWVTRDNIEVEKRKCEEELASIQQIMEETMNESAQNNTKYEKDIRKLQKINEKLEAEVQELKNQSAADKEGVLAVMTKTLAKRVVSLNAHSASTENIPDTLEDSMKKAQEDAEMLRSLVVPLEEEIKALKDKLRSADDQLRMYEAAQANFLTGSNAVAELLKGRTPADVVAELDEKLKDLHEDLKAEKSSRSDLEMYVAVLQTQKTVLQEDTDKLRKEVQEVCRLLENEKREHNDLKQTWQMANDQFLEVQRLQMMDMRRMHSLLTMEQQRLLSEMQKRDEERMEQEKRVQRFFQIREEQEKLKLQEGSKGSVSPMLSRLSTRRRKSPSPNRANTPEGSAVTDTPVSLKDFICLERPRNDVSFSSEHTGLEDSLLSIEASVNLRDADVESAGLMTASLDTSVDLSEVDEPVNRAEGYESGGDGDTSSLSTQMSERIPNLTEAQFKAIADLTPEQEARQQLLESARSRPETLMVAAGKRLVSEKEWQLLQEELKKARDKLSRTCDMCSNYEAQLQKVQEHEKDMEKQIRSLEKMLAAYKDNLAREQTYRKEIEEKVSSMSEDAQKQVAELFKKLEQVEKSGTDLRHHYNGCRHQVAAQLKSLSAERESVQVELTRLQKENDLLVGKYSVHAQQMQNEAIELPTDLDEIHHLLLKLREELISAKIAKEQIEETLRSEILFLKDHVTAEQHAKNTIEDNLTQEIDTLRTQVGTLESIKQQQQEEQSRRADAERLVKELQAAQNNSRHMITSMQKQLEELNSNKSELENEVHQLRCKVQSLQVDLDNNEAVQRDFVKLSQSLQVQLEKIRESETQVRWQHEEDVEECNNCKLKFQGGSRRKLELDLPKQNYYAGLAGLHAWPPFFFPEPCKSFCKLDYPFAVFKLETLLSGILLHRGSALFTACSEEVYAIGDARFDSHSLCRQCLSKVSTEMMLQHHCHHCGKIFCLDCVSKNVQSGPKRRSSRVCDVCHTLLVPNTAPYFSKEPPHTPD